MLNVKLKQWRHQMRLDPGAQVGEARLAHVKHLFLVFEVPPVHHDLVGLGAVLRRASPLDVEVEDRVLFALVFAKRHEDVLHLLVAVEAIEVYE